MTKKFFMFFLITATSVAVFFFYRFFLKQNVDLDTRKKIVCTTTIISDVVRQIGGDKICVRGLMGPGVDPHIYHARESDVRALLSADAIFYNGIHLEGKMVHILEKMTMYTTSVAVADTIPKQLLLKTEFEDIYDPHVWHDVLLWIYAVEKIRDTLIEIDYKNKNYYLKNSDKYIQKLRKLDLYIKQQISCILPKQRVLITAHDAFAYFGRRYGFEVVGLQSISTACDISVKDILDVANYIVKRSIAALFVESSLPIKNIQAVQKAVEFRGWSVAIGPEIFSDALGDPETFSGTYEGMIKHNIDTIRAALVI